MLLSLALVTGAHAQTLHFVAGNGSSTVLDNSFVAPGDILYFRLIDPTANVTPGVRTITVQTQREQAPFGAVIEDTETVTLTANDFNATEFFGFIGTSFGNAIKNDGTVEVRGSSQVQALFGALTTRINVGIAGRLEFIAGNPTGATFPAPNLAQPGDATVLGSLTGSPALGVVVPGSILYFRYKDDDANRDSGNVLQIVTVNVTSNVGDVKAVTLSQVALDSNVFIGRVQTKDETSPDASPSILAINGKAAAPQVITAGVLDPQYPSTTATAAAFPIPGPALNTPLPSQTVPASAVVERTASATNVPGVSSIDFVDHLADDATVRNNSFVNPGDTLYIRATGFIGDNNGPGNDTLTVSLTVNRFAANPPTEDFELVTLVESPTTPGNFFGSIKTMIDPRGTATPNDGQLQVRGHSRILLSATPNGGSPPTRQMNVGIVGAVGLISGNITEPGVNPIPQFSVPVSAQQGAELTALQGAAALGVAVPGSVLYFRIIDDDRNLSLSATDTFPLRVRSLVNGLSLETKTVTMVETGLDTGIFIGRIQTAQSKTSLPDPNTLALDGTATLSTVAAEFDDPQYPTTTTVACGLPPCEMVASPLAVETRNTTVSVAHNASATFINGMSSIDFVSNLSDTGNVTIDNEFVAPGTDLLIRASGMLGDNNGPGNDTMTVTVATFRNGTGAEDQEPVTLIESPTLPGTFFGRLHTNFNPLTPPIANDGTLEVRGASQAQVFFRNAINSGLPESRINFGIPAKAELIQGLPQGTPTNAFTNLAPNFTIQELQGLQGAPALGAFVPGQILYVRVTDDDRNQNPGTMETITATVTSNVLGETETVNLVETGPDTGIFLGRIQTIQSATAAAGDGTLEVNGKTAQTGNVGISFGDPQYPSATVAVNGFPIAPSPLPLVAQTGATPIVGTGSTGLTLTPGTTTLNFVSQLDPNAPILDDDFITPGDTLYIRMANVTGGNAGPANDTISVTIQTRRTISSGSQIEDTENVTLTESPTVDGVFLGSIHTAFGPAIPGNGQLEVRGRSKIQLVSSNAGIPAAGTGELNVGIVSQMDFVAGNQAVSPANLLALTPTTIPANEQVALQSAGDIGKFNPGDILYVRVVDDDRNRNADDTTTVTVSVASNVAGETKVVNLIETGNDTGIFVGRIGTKRGTSADGSDANRLVVNNFAQGVVTATFQDTQYPSHQQPPPAGDVGFPIPFTAPLPSVNRVATVTIQGVITNGTVKLLEATVNPTSTNPLNGPPTAAGEIQFITAGDTVLVQVTDPDRSVNVGVTNNASVTVNTNGGEANKILNLTETAAGSGIFEGLLKTVFGTAATGNPNTFAVQAGVGAVQVSYADPDTLPGATANVTTSLDVRGGVTGQLIVSPSSPSLLFPGQTLNVTVNDLDVFADVNPGPSNDTVTVTVTSYNGVAGTGTAIDQESFEVSESAVEGTFFRPLPVEFVAVGFPAGSKRGDGRIQVVAGGSVRVRYFDRLRTSGQINDYVPDLALGDPETGLVNVSLNPAPVPAPVLKFIASLTPGGGAPAGIVPGSTLYVELDDANFSLTPDVNAVSVNITSTYGDSEQVRLVETGPHTGVFTGSILTAFGPLGTGTPPDTGNAQFTNDGTLQLITRDYRTSNPVAVVSITEPATLATLQASIAVIKGNTITKSAGTITFVAGEADGAPAIDKIQPGDNLYIRVVDQTRDIVPTGTLNNVTVTVTTTSGDSEVVFLRETAVPGTFAGHISTVLANPVVSSGTLEVRGRDTLTAVYKEPTPVATLTTTAIVQTNAVVAAVTGLAPNAGDVTFVQLGGTLFIKVVDDDMNLNPNVLEQVTVQVTVSAHGSDSETVVCTETDPNSGIFVGSIQVVSTQGRGPGGTNGTVTPSDGILEFDDSGNTLNLIGPPGPIFVTYTDNNVPTPALGAETPQTHTVRVNVQVGPGNGTGTPIVPPTTARILIKVPSGGTYTPLNTLDKFIAGSPMFIEVDDADLDTSPQINQVNVTVTVTSTTPAGPILLDQEVFTLTETGLGSGVFTLLQPTNLGPTKIGDGNLSLSGNDFVTASVFEAQDAYGRQEIVSTQVQVAAGYQSGEVVKGISGQGVTITLPNGATLSIPSQAVPHPLTATFKLQYSVSGANGPTDESGNQVPLPLDPNVQLLKDEGKFFWYELQPTGITFRKPLTLFIPIPNTSCIGACAATISAAQKAATRMVFFDGMDWLAVGGVLKPKGSAGNPDATNDYVVTTINHFTTLALAVDTRTPPDPSGPLVTGIKFDSNPFSPNHDGINDTTTLQFSLSETATVTVKVFDSNGDLVRTLLSSVVFPAGFVSTQWDGSYLFSDRIVPSGLYIMQILATGVSGKTAKESALVGVVK